MLVDNLNVNDRVGIVVYGSRGKVILEPTSIERRHDILSAIEWLRPEGSTNADEGLRLGYDMAERMFEPGKINRIILCSDGVANVGLTSAEDLLERIKRYAEKGITLTTVGFGMGNYNDILMEKLGNKGNGFYAYVDDFAEAKRIFMENLTGTLQVIARDVKIQVDFDPQVVRSYRLLGYENRDVDDDKFRDDKEDGGEIGSGHQVTALYEIKFFKDNKTDRIGTMYIRYKDPDNGSVSELSRDITRGDFRNKFESCSADFKLAAAAAELAEILRKSYWAKGSQLSDVYDLAKEVFLENDSQEMVEFLNMISKADKFSDERAEK
jgi:Ca-activated chloride channel family protein